MTAKEEKDAKGGSTVLIAISALVALGAAYGVYYCYDQARKSEDLLIRSKSEYKKMGEMKRPVEEYLRQRKGRAPVAGDNTEDMMVFLDKKSRESQIPPGSITLSKNNSSNVGTWVETSYTATLSGTKDAGIRKQPLVEFLRRVEAERRSTKVKSLQLAFSGDEFKSSTITFSEFTPKQ